MTKIETLKDLMITGDVTRGDVCRIARRLFDGISYVDENSLLSDAYNIRIPAFDDLPDREQSYLIKVLLECSVLNKLEYDAEAELDREIEDGADTDSTRTSMGPVPDPAPEPEILDDYQR